MCGIYGYFDRLGRQLSDEVLARMGTVIEHRGPDGSGIGNDPARGIALGNQRLAILDVEHGQQPFVSDDGLITLVQNGEIFNYRELAAELKADGAEFVTTCDTEVLLRLYERDGIDFVSQLNGMFAIAIDDKRDDCLYLIRDRIGEKPLYFCDDGERMVFASEIKSILQAIDTPAPCDLALYYYLALNYVPPPLTAFEKVRHVMPGHWMRFDREGARTEQWWDLGSVRSESRTELEWIGSLQDTLSDAVRIRLRSDVPFGAFLSGGVDSSSVVALMSEHLDEPVNTFSIGFDDPRFDESSYSELAAARFGCEHYAEIVDPDMFANWPMTIYHCDQPHGDVSFLPTHRVAELAARKVKMVLTGDGGDELFAGYGKYLSYFSTARGGVARPVTRDYINELSLFRPPELSRVLQPSFASRVSNADAFTDLVEPHLDRVRHMDPVNQVLYLDMMLLLPGNNLVKPDRMGMAVSIENRAAFMDYRMMELAFQIPGPLKLRDGETKYILKKAVAPFIGDDLAYRAKQMFTVPVGEWLRTSMYDGAVELLMSRRSRVLDYVDRNVVETMLTDHRDNRANHTREIRALMALELWFNTFFA